MNSTIRKAMQCPRVGCSEWAMFAVMEDIHDGELLLWTCSAGHHGPHVVTLEAEDSTITNHN